MRECEWGKGGRAVCGMEGGSWSGGEGRIMGMKC